MDADSPKTEDKRNVLQPTEDFARDFKKEVKLEVDEIKGTGEPVNPNQTDQLVQKHVTGLAISFFILIALVLLAAIGVIYWYAHANHQTQRPGMNISRTVSSESRTTA